VARIAQAIHLLRGQKVMLDLDLAALYGVATKALNQAVKRNRIRFPDDFMFQLSGEEIERISQIVTLKRGQNIKYRPYTFTEQGVAMLSSVLNSDRAGERTRLACWRWRPRHRELFLRRTIQPFAIASRKRFPARRRKEHASRVCSPIRNHR
jgi:hypothetical protein